MGVRVKFKVLRDRERVSRGKDAGARGNPRFPNGRRGRTHGRPFELFDLTEVTAATSRSGCKLQRLAQRASFVSGKLRLFT